MPGPTGSRCSEILDPERTEILFNSTWSDKLGADGMIRVAATYTVARMLEREDFGNRFRSNQPIAIHEFLYPLMQGYDSVAMKCDIELGGTDRSSTCWSGASCKGISGSRPSASHHAAAGGPGRDQQDVQVAGKLRRHQ